MYLAENKQRRRGENTVNSSAAKRCAYQGKKCPEHLVVHGAEAEELRAGIEKLLAKPGPATVRQWRLDLIDLLDTTDARDSLAYVEALQARRRAK